MSAEVFSVNGLMLEIFDQCHFDPTSSLAEQLKEKASQVKLLEQALQEYQLKCICGIARDTSIVSEDRQSRRGEHSHKKSQTSANMSDFIGSNAVLLAKKSEGHTRNKSVGDGRALNVSSAGAEPFRSKLPLQRERSNSTSAIMKSKKRAAEKDKNGMSKASAQDNNNSNNTSNSTSNTSNQPLPRRAFSIANGTSPRSPLSSRTSGVNTRKSDKNGGGVGSGKRGDVPMGARSHIKLKFTYPIMDGYIYRLKGTRGELRFRFQLTDMEKFEKVAFIDVFDCEAEQNLQSHIEVSNILRGNFKLVVDEKMQLSNKRLCLRVHCTAKQQTASAPSKPQAVVFETKKFHVEFTGAQGSNALVKSSKAPNATPSATKTKAKTAVTKKAQKNPNRKTDALSQPKKNKAPARTNAKNTQVHNPKEDNKDNQTNKGNNHSQPLSLPQSSENSGDIKAPETKSDDERNQLGDKHLPLADNPSIAESVGSQDMDDANGTQPRLSLIKSKYDENNQPADFTDSSEEEEEELDSGDEQVVDSPDSPVHHPRTQESAEIDRLMKRKFSTRGPTFNNHSTVLEDPDLVIVVGYSDSDEDRDS